MVKFLKLEQLSPDDERINKLVEQLESGRNVNGAWLDEDCEWLLALLKDSRRSLNLLSADYPCALLIGGQFDGRLVQVTGPYEHHFEEGVEYIVIPRGDDTWKFPIRYQAKEAAPCDHEWVDARNEVVLSGEICVKCHTVRAGNS